MRKETLESKEVLAVLDDEDLNFFGGVMKNDWAILLRIKKWQP